MPERRPSAKEFQTLLLATYGASESMIRQAYPTDTPAALLRSELDFYADGGFTYPMWKWALMQRATSMPVYFYQFGRTLPPMPGQLYKGLPRAELGAFHGDEVAYAFGTLNSAFGAMDQLSRKIAGSASITICRQRWWDIGRTSSRAAIPMAVVCRYGRLMSQFREIR